MTVHTAQSVIRYVSTDLDEFAAALADLADAIDRRDSTAALEHLERVTAIDPDTGNPLADFLTFMDMFEEV